MNGLHITLLLVAVVVECFTVVYEADSSVDRIGGCDEGQDVLNGPVGPRWGTDPVEIQFLLGYFVELNLLFMRLCFLSPFALREVRLVDESVN